MIIQRSAIMALVLSSVFLLVRAADTAADGNIEAPIQELARLVRTFNVTQLTEHLMYDKYQGVINDPIDNDCAAERASALDDGVQSSVRATGVRRSIAQKMTLLDLAYVLQKDGAGVVSEERRQELCEIINLLRAYGAKATWSWERMRPDPYWGLVAVTGVVMYYLVR